MKSPSVGDLVPNEIVTGHFLVVAKDIRQKKTGEPYLSLHLADKTGEIESKMWDNVTEVMDTFDRDDFIKVKGITQVYQNRSQFTIHKLRRMEDHEVQFDDFFPCSAREPEEMFAELRGIISGVGNAHLRELLESVFNDNETAKLFKMAPAAKTIHHAWRGGLLEHVLSLCNLARATAPNYPHVDLDLLLTGAILHDIGKIEELTFVRSFGYSTDGQLLGHIVLGLRLLGRKFDKLPQFPQKLRSLVEHMLVSHHGELEFGSPKVPVFAEALLFHHLDNLDSKMNAFECALKRDHLVEGMFTGWVSSLERVLMRKERYLAEVEAKPVLEKPAVAMVTDDLPTPAAAAEVIAEPALDEPSMVKPLPVETLPVGAGPVETLPIETGPPIPVVTPVVKRAEMPAPMNSLFAEKLQAVLGPQK